MPEQRAEQRLFFTELLGLKVFDLKGRTLGVVKDAAIVPLLDPVRVDRFLIGSGAAWLTVRHDQVRSISLDGIHLRDEILTPYHSDEYMLRVVRDLLDQQIIDAQGRKVVRVTDVTFEVRQENGGDVLWVLDVDIGMRGIFRRLVQGVAAGALDPAAAGGNSAAFHPLGVLQHSGARSAAAAAPEYLQPAAGGHASRRPGRHRRRPDAGASRSDL